MGKKSKRQTSKGTGPASFSSTVSASAAEIPVARTTRGMEREFNPDYAPVIRDLRRIGILAGSFFIVLLALTFFLR